MLSEHFSSISGIAIYPIVSMLIAIAFFTITIIWVFKLDKSYIREMGNLPLDNTTEHQNNFENEDEVI